MIRHFFIDKANTIMKGTKANLGLNPILKLNYGNDLTRGLLHFDDSELREMYKNEEINSEVSTFKLKMTNCMSVDGLPYEKELVRSGVAFGQRACSFDLLLFVLPQEFDAGRGFDFLSDFWIKGGQSKSTDGSNWYFAKSGIVWEDEREKVDLNDETLNWKTVIKDKNIEGGIYTQEIIKEEYEKFLNGEDSIFIGSQHFDFGMENLDIDITEYVRKMLVNDEPNYGLGIMFAPMYEKMATDISQYVGFFTNNTNTFFHPYVEMYCADEINDDRNDFVYGKENNLYFFAEVDGMPVKFDEVPVCTIEGEEYPVEMVRKGVYKAKINDLTSIVDEESIMYDEWSNLTLNGAKIANVEMEFEVHPYAYRMNLGKIKSDRPDLVPSVSGMNDLEHITRKDIRTINIDFREKFNTEKIYPAANIAYRIYVKDGKDNREFDVIDYTPTERAFYVNFFKIYGMDLVPNDYYVDIKVEDSRGVKNYKEILKFTVDSNVTERYE